MSKIIFMSPFDKITSYIEANFFSIRYKDYKELEDLILDFIKFMNCSHKNNKRKIRLLKKYESIANMREKCG